MRLNVLLLCTVPPGAAGTTRDHVAAFGLHSTHRIFTYPYIGQPSNRLPASLILDRFDAIIIHYTVYLLSDHYLGPGDRARIAAYRGTKVLFVQDEYRQVNHMIMRINELGIDVLFTCVPADEVEKVYPAHRLPGVTKVSNLTGYVPEALCQRRVLPIAQRPIDVGYRSRIVPYWLGSLGAEKWQIAPRFVAAAKESGLKLDISNLEEDRLYGRQWIRFVASCKAMLGVESGASVFDFDGTLQLKVEEHLLENPSATFEEVHARYLREHEGRIRLNQISPRSFEAAALRTAMVLYEGQYSGLLVPGRHYIPLRKDFGNMEEVIDSLRDDKLLQELVDRTYEEVARAWENSYCAFIGRVDAAIEEAASVKACRMEGGMPRYKFILVSIPSSVYPWLLGCWLWLPAGVRATLRPALRSVRALFSRRSG